VLPLLLGQIVAAFRRTAAPTQPRPERFPSLDPRVIRVIAVPPVAQMALHDNGNDNSVRRVL
tara:strand:+ start:799 stop:984 length:186 start_codon:yes stop_codon:yes gene_type:complete